MKICPGTLGRKGHVRSLNAYHGYPLTSARPDPVSAIPCWGGHRRAPRLEASQLPATSVTRLGMSPRRSVQSNEAVTSVLDISPVAGVYTVESRLRRRLGLCT